MTLALPTQMPGDIMVSDERPVESAIGAAGRPPRRRMTSHAKTVNERDLTPDQAAWLPVAEAVLAGQHDGPSSVSSAREALVIGLRAVNHRLCVEALAHFECRDKAKERPRKVKAKEGDETAI